MESQRAQSVLHILPEDADSQPKRQLIEFLTENTVPLLGTLHFYVQRMGLARGEAVQMAALEILQETVVEALDHAERFDPTRRPMAWLLGIATNMIKRKKVEGAKRYQRELSIAAFSKSFPDLASESELFDQVTSATFAGPEAGIESAEQAAALLALVSKDDQEILRLAFLYDFEREALAEKLRITPGAARVRLHRALNRLREAWREQQIQEQREESNE